MVDLQKLTKERIYIGNLTAKDDGKKVNVAGWLYDSRDLGKIRFVLLRDISGEIQVTAVKGEVKEEGEGVITGSGVIGSGINGWLEGWFKGFCGSISMFCGPLN